MTLRCPVCNNETEVRYGYWTDEVEGAYCETCNKTLDYERGEWEDGDIGCEKAWLGTADWDLDQDDDE